MSGPKDAAREVSVGGSAPRVRRPVFAGMFYPQSAAKCRAQADVYVKRWINGGARQAERPSRQLIGGIVPHAGWICSGAIAGETIGTIAASRIAAGVTKTPDVVIVLGAVHTPIELACAALDDFDRWQAPGSTFDVTADLRRRLRERNSERFATDDRFHEREHAVEVELPLIESAWPDAKVLPIEVPLIEDAAEIGRQIASVIASEKLDAIVLASSDLTHYGPAYRFAPAGVGVAALEWAKDNDRRLLERVARFDVEGIVGEVSASHNACGGGAIAAMLAACRELGARDARVLRHANSYEVLAAAVPLETDNTADNAVGYAAVVA